MLAIDRWQALDNEQQQTGYEQKGRGEYRVGEQLVEERLARFSREEERNRSGYDEQRQALIRFFEIVGEAGEKSDDQPPVIAREVQRAVGWSTALLVLVRGAADGEELCDALYDT